MAAEKDKTLTSALGLTARRWAVLPLQTMIDCHCSCGHPACDSPGTTFPSRLFPAPRLVQTGDSAPKLLPLTSTLAAVTLKAGAL